MDHRKYLVHYENSITFEDLQNLKSLMTTEELSEMYKRINPILNGVTKWNSFESKVLAEKFLELGYLSSYVKFTDFHNFPPTDPPTNLNPKEGG